LCLASNLECARNDLRSDDVPRRRNVFDVNTSEDLLETVAIMEDVVPKRRRVFGPAHPHTHPHPQRKIYGSYARDSRKL